MTSQDLTTHADLMLRVIQRVKAAPELNTAAPQDALLTILTMIEHEYRAAPQIVQTDDAT